MLQDYEYLMDDLVFSIFVNFGAVSGLNNAFFEQFAQKVQWAVGQAK